MRILLVDDEEVSRELVADFLVEQLGYEVVQAADGLAALTMYKESPFPIVISDMKMPGLTGLDLLKNIRNHPNGKGTDFILITGYADIESVVQALRLGAYDYIQKPIDIEYLALVINKTVEHQQLMAENKAFKEDFAAQVTVATEEKESRLQQLQRAYAQLVGVDQITICSQAMQNVVAMAEKLHADREVPVLLEGATGTGKEVIARLIHYGRGEETAPFVTLNCSAITPTLFESELFGYEEGAFTGAKKRGAIGKLELAQGGTLFLDEIGDLPLDMQPKLLRVLQQKEIFRVGGIRKIQLDVRIICATNRDLREMVEEGTYRQDLYYRLNVGRIYISPLKERRDDILPLAQMFLERVAEQKKKRFRFISKAAKHILENYDWPGNVREIQNTIERVVLMYDDIELKAEHLSILTDDLASMPLLNGSLIEPGKLILPDTNLPLELIEAEVIRKALQKNNGNQSQTASYLMITRSVLRSKMKKYDLE